MSTKTSDLARMRLMLQGQSQPNISITPVQDIGGGLSQAANNILQVMMQRRNQEILQEMLQQEQKSAIAAQNAKRTGLIPVADKLGMDVDTLMALPDAALTQLSGELYKAQQDQQDMQAKALSLKNSTMLPQQSLLLDEAGRIPLEQEVGMMTRPIMDESQALDLIRTGGDKPLVDALAAARAFQAGNLAIDAIVPDRSGLNGQKIYRNLYQEAFGNAPVTDSQILQENANLQNTLLGNQNAAIINRFLPEKEQLGLVNSSLDASGKIQEQSWKPYLNTAGIANTQANTANTLAGTPGVEAESERKANELAIQNEVIRITTDDTIPVEKRAALVSGLVTNSKDMLENLKTMSGKEGLLGIKGKTFKETMDVIQQETNAIKNPPKPAPGQAKPQPVKTPPKPAAPKPYRKVGQQASAPPPPTMFQVVSRGLQSMFTPDPQKVNTLYGKVFGTQSPPAQPQKPVTLPGIRAAKQKAQAGVQQVDKRIQQKQATLTQNTQDLSNAEALMNLVNEGERRRAEMLKKQFVGF